MDTMGGFPVNTRHDVFNNSTIRRTVEFERIANLPRRTWTAEQTRACVAHYTAALRTPTGTMELLPLQAIALHEIRTIGGLLGPLSVGSGKTLLTLLAPFVLGAVRPVLLLPASLIDKTRREMGLLMVHWQIPRNIRMMGYELLSRVSSAEWLETWQPDLIIADEAHRLKNTRAGVTRRVKRFMDANPHTRCIMVSGTLIKDNIEDFAHLSAWALKSWSPIPNNYAELTEWSECLGQQKNPLHTVQPGPLLQLDDMPTEGDDITRARQAFGRRLRATPGVVASGDTDVACSLYITALAYQPSVRTETNFMKLRGTPGTCDVRGECPHNPPHYNGWETPDGWTLSQATDVWRHARELAIGFHYLWDPRPPMEWLEARRQWAKFVRSILSDSRTYDTMMQVRLVCEEQVEGAVKRGQLDPTLWNNWAAIKDTFQANQTANWHDDTALEICRKWAREPGIIWTEHVFFGRELARRTGLTYYGEEGLSEDGRSISDADPTKSIVASSRANATGRNLQAYSRNLITAAPASGLAWEQLLGRTHRHGQRADTVTCDVLMGCIEHYTALVNAIADARMTSDTMGVSQKLQLADVNLPDEQTIEAWGRASPRYRKVGE